MEQYVKCLLTHSTVEEGKYYRVVAGSKVKLLLAIPEEGNEHNSDWLDGEYFEKATELEMIREKMRKEIDTEKYVKCIGGHFRFVKIGTVYEVVNEQLNSYTIKTIDEYGEERNGTYHKKYFIEENTPYSEVIKQMKKEINEQV